jgi:hypothetical protein
MAADFGPALVLDFLNRPINIHWGGGLHFLYSGADGMFGSKDGEEWKKAPPESSVPATALAWVDNVWLALGGGTTWRSEDGGKIWEVASGPQFQQIAACKPQVVEDEPIKNGVFAGYKSDDEGEHEEVYLSDDLGKTWSKVLNIPTKIPFGDGEDGYEYAQVLSGCGNGIFLSTIKGDERSSNGDGCVYASMNGAGFGARQQIWSGTIRHPDDPLPERVQTKTYSAGAVGFDSETQQFCLMCLKEEGFGPGGAEGSAFNYSIIYATGSDGSFSGENEIIKRLRGALEDPYRSVNGGLAATGGDGRFAGTYNDLFHTSSELQGDLVIAFFGGGAGSETLLAGVDMFAGARIGPVCWKPGSESESTPETPTGTFACVAFSSDTAPGEGGVWIAKADGSWQKKHDGQAGQRGAIAVGKLSWFGDNGD